MKVLNDYTNWNMDVIDKKKITYFEDTQYPLPTRKKKNKPNLS